MTESTASRNLCKIRRSPLGMLFVINFLLWPVLMAQAGKKQTFNGADGNKVEVEVLDNPTKVYEENGDLYLIPGQTYKFKMTGTAGAGYVVKGTKTVTSGNLTVDADKPKSLLDVGQMIFKDSENSIIVAVKIKVVIPDFKSLSVTGAVAPGLLELKNGGYQLGGGTLPHVGIVTVKPVAARQEFEIHMEQWINVKTTKNGDNVTNLSKNGRDSDYPPPPNSKVENVGNDQIIAISEDVPGLSATAVQWNSDYQNKVIVVFDFKAFVYLRYSIKGKNGWKTLGKIPWSLYITFDPTKGKSLVDSAIGKLSPPKNQTSEGIAISEEPKAP